MGGKAQDSQRDGRRLTRTLTKSKLSDSCDQESAVRPLVDIVDAAGFRAAHRILFTHDSLLGPPKGRRLMVARAFGAADANAIEALEALSTAGFERVIAGELRNMMHFVHQLQRELGIEDDDEELAPEREAEVIAHAVKAGAAGSELGQAMRRVFAETGQDLTRAATASTLRFVGQMLELQTRAVGDEHYAMVDQLIKLELAEPWLRVAVCSACLAHELATSTFADPRGHCGRCRREWFVAEALVLRREFDGIKRGNRDLPLFVRGYLRRKVPASCEIWTNAVFKTPAGKQEVDVCIPALGLGIECKTFPDPFVTTDSKRSSIAGELAKQARGYAALGLRSFVAATNLGASDTEAVASDLQARINGDADIADVLLLPGDVSVILSALEDIAKRLNENERQTVRERHGGRHRPGRRQSK